MPLTSLEITGWVFFALGMAAVVCTCAWVVWLSVQSSDGPNGPMPRLTDGGLSRSNRVGDDAVLTALAQYSVDQMRNGGWKDVCDNVKVNILGNDTHLTNMDLSGWFISGNSDGTTSSTDYNFMTCASDSSDCAHCVCDNAELFPATWFDHGCDPVKAGNGCGGWCAGTGPGTGCCNLGPFTALFRLKLGTLEGVDSLFNYVSAQSASYDSGSGSLVVTVTLVSAPVTMANATAGYKVCTPLGAFEDEAKSMNITAVANGQVKLTVPFTTPTPCSMAVDFASAALDFSGVAVSNIAGTVDSQPLTAWLQAAINPICAAAMVSPVVGGLCFAAVQPVFTLMQKFMGDKLAGLLSSEIPANAMSGLGKLAIPVPCIFDASSVAALHASRRRAGEDPPPPGALLLPPSIGDAVAQLLLPAINATVAGTWKKSAGWPTFPDFDLNAGGKAFVSIPDAPVVSGLVFDDANSWIDLPNKTAQLAVKAVVLTVKGAGLMLATNDVVDAVALNAGFSLQAGVLADYDPAKGGSVSFDILKLTVDSATYNNVSGGNSLGALLAQVLQAQNGAAPLCLARLALQNLTMPIQLAAISLPAGLPLPKTTTASGRPSR
jgi:hypothetical protein